MNKKDINEIIEQLSQATLSNGDTLSVDKFEGDETVVCISVEDREEFPIYLTIDEGQILVITYLFSDNQVRAEQKTALMESMLILNVSIPLSAFSKISDQYIMFGALSPASSFSDLLREIELLSDNVLLAIEAVSEYLISNDQ